MPQQLLSGRRYREEEVSEILQRAGQLQRTVKGDLTSEEIQQIGKELGLDPAAVRRAIDEREQARSPGKLWLGAPVFLKMERRVAGTLTEEDLSRIADEIREVLGSVGQVSLLPGSLTWSAYVSNAPLEVLVTSRQEEITVRVNSRHGNLAGGLLGGIGGGVGGGLSPALAMGVTSATGSLVLGVAAGVVTVLASLLGARAVYASVVRRREDKLHQLMERIDQVLKNRLPGTPPS